MKLNIAILVLSLSGFHSAFAESASVIVNPSNRETGLPISIKSNPDGVCAYFHFDHALKGSVHMATESVTYANGRYERMARRAQRTGIWLTDLSPTHQERDAVKAQSIVLDESGQASKQVHGKVIGSITCINP